MTDKDEKEETKHVYRSQDKERRWRVITSFAMMAAGIIFIIVLMFIRGHKPG